MSKFDYILEEQDSAIAKLAKSGIKEVVPGVLVGTLTGKNWEQTSLIVDYLREEWGFAFLSPEQYELLKTP